MNEYGAVTEFDGDQKRMTDEQKRFTRAVLNDFIRNNPNSQYITKVKNRLEDMDASALGGIDFNAALIDWQGDAVILPNNNSSIFSVPVRYAPVEGLRPARIDIAPLKTMPHLLGLPSR